MRGRLSDASLFDSREPHDLEWRIATWMAQQQPGSPVAAAVVLGVTFAAMVVLALVR